MNVMKKTVFTGAATAIVTPLNENGVDYGSFGRLIDWQISEGINAIVVAGTTGEGSTLSDEEHRQVLKFAVDRIDGKVPVIAGTGSNDTAYAIDLTKYACSIGADAMLVVSPYYNKATQNGLIKTFMTTRPWRTSSAATSAALRASPGRYGCRRGSACPCRLAAVPCAAAVPTRTDPAAFRSGGWRPWRPTACWCRTCAGAPGWGITTERAP